MTTDQAIRYLALQARTCRDRDTCEAFCLLLPAFLKVYGLSKMEDVEEAAFKHWFKMQLLNLPEHDAKRAA